MPLGRPSWAVHPRPDPLAQVTGPSSMSLLSSRRQVLSSMTGVFGSDAGRPCVWSSCVCGILAQHIWLSGSPLCSCKPGSLQCGTLQLAKSWPRSAGGLNRACPSPDAAASHPCASTAGLLGSTHLCINKMMSRPSSLHCSRHSRLKSSGARSNLSWVLPVLNMLV